MAEVSPGETSAAAPAVPTQSPPPAPLPVAATAPSAPPSSGPPKPSLVVKHVALGPTHTCAILADGTVRCWGSNSAGELGAGGHTEPSTGIAVPIAVPGVTGATHIAAAHHRTCVRLMDATLRCWGDRTLMLTPQGAAVGGTRSPAAVPGLGPIEEIAMGARHDCVRRRGDGVLCWGENVHGQLGDGTKEPRADPIPTRSVRDTFSISAGGLHTCVVGQVGRVRCWGSNTAGELGTGDTAPRLVPTPVAGLTGAAEVALDSQSSCARMEDGTVRCWGGEKHGPGSHATPELIRSRPDPVTGIAGARRIAVRQTRGCAVLTDGSLRCWSRDGNVPIGIATEPFPELRDVVEVGLGLRHSCVVLGTGELRCWGDNHNGQLGDGTFERRETPTPVRN